MKFRNYCIVVMGNTVDAISEITSISESAPNTPNSPNVLDAKGILIATFTSFVEPSELTDFFKQKNRNFLLFDLNKDCSGVNIVKEEINQGLFGFLSVMTDENLQQKTYDLIKEISSSTMVSSVRKSDTNRSTEPMISLEEIDEMTPKDRENLLNDLLEKGSDKLSEYDKKILKKLAIS